MALLLCERQQNWLRVVTMVFMTIGYVITSTFFYVFSKSKKSWLFYVFLPCFVRFLELWFKLFNLLNHAFNISFCPLSHCLLFGKLVVSIVSPRPNCGCKYCLVFEKSAFICRPIRCSCDRLPDVQASSSCKAIHCVWRRLIVMEWRQACGPIGDSTMRHTKGTTLTL